MNAQPDVAPRRSAASRPRITRRTAGGIGIAVAAALLTSACAAGQQAQTADEHSVIDGQNQNVGNIKLRDVAIAAPPSAGRYYLAGTDAQLTLAFVNSGRSADRLVNITASVAKGWAAFSDYNDAHLVQQASGAEVSGTPSAAPSAAGSTESTGTPTGSTPESGSESSSESTSQSAGSSTPGGGTSTAPSGSTSGASSTPASSSSAAPLPTGTQSVTLPAGARVTFGLPESTGALLLTGLTKRLYPGTTVQITMTFARAGTAKIFVPVQVAAIGRTAEVEGGGGEEG